MRVVWSWLRELIALDSELHPQQAADALTAAGLEVESVETVGDDFSGVVVAEVVGKSKHTDKLTLVELIDEPGGQKTDVICGADNVPEPGGLVLWAKPGAILPGPQGDRWEIATKVVKGVTSHGMICSESELGLGDDQAGIIVLDDIDVRHGGFHSLVGDSRALERLGIRDRVFEIGIYANRPDTLGHVGIARELAALVGGQLKPIEFSDTPSADNLPEAGPSEAFHAAEELIDRQLDAASLVSVEIADPQGCPRYIARVVDDVSVGPSPRWMQQRLRAVGLRPISNLVDVTNYVMFHYGQPLHAFDYQKVGKSHIAVRRAESDQRLTTLDDVERSLEPDDLLICDGHGPIALAGIMGGKDSEVSESTRRVLLETANFEPTGIRRTARRLNLHSDGSHRFERGVDPNITDHASRMACVLLARLGGGKIASGSVEAYVRRIEKRTVAMRASRASMLTGVDFSRDEAGKLLSRLGITVADDPHDSDTLHATCPTFRIDLTREVDLIEEVIRLHGMHNVPATLPASTITRSRAVDPRPSRARRALVASGLCETITFGYSSEERLRSLRLDASDRRASPIRVRNPMTSDQAIMRTLLLPNLLAQVARNLSFGIKDIALFEVGSVFLPSETSRLADEPVHVAGIMTGRRPGWLRDGGAIDFYDIKGVVERLAVEFLDRQVPRYAADSSVPYMHPGVCASFAVPATEPDGQKTYRVAGYLGEIHPATREVYDIDQACFAFELQLAAFPTPEAAQMSEIPRYPAVTRDVSLFLDKAVPAGHIEHLIASTGQSLSGEMAIERVALLEEYRDPAKVPAGKKGMLWSITYRSSERTLTDSEVNNAHSAVETRMLSELPGAERR
ncbi:MAG: phenylalanine--tRNA ligase subunit beta [Proteobacteria bacterium]|nr:phenylalanine--tRNA ligase subunit beta [Pseudomonadota bacterium]